MNALKRAGKALFGGFARGLFALSIVYIGVRYLPKVIYTDKKATKEALKKPCILISNHTSHTDGIFVTRLIKKYHAYTYVAKDWYEKKFAKPFFESLAYIPMDRHDLDTGWLEKGIEKIRQGNSILIFPEGKTSKGAMNEFKPGFLYLARRTGVPVIPMAVIGKYKAFHRQKLVIGAPIALDLQKKGRPSVILAEGALACKAEVQALLDTYSSSGKNGKDAVQEEKKAA